MAGHSKWANTKRRKGAVDLKRGKIFSVLSKEITISARLGGGDPNGNARLRTVLLKARFANMPSDNVERAIKKGTGELEGAAIEEVTYEGYGPHGVGLIIEATTDNRNRTAGEIRSTFTKGGGNLAGPGALAFNFAKKGQIIIARDVVEEDKLMEIVLEAGADDLKVEDDHYEVLTGIGPYYAVSDALAKAKIATEQSEIAWLPNLHTTISDIEQARKILGLIEALEEWDDVSHVYANHEFTPEVRAILDNE